MKKTRRSSLLAAPVVAAALTAIAAAIPATRAAATAPALVDYQGVLRSASGAPLNGTYDMVFRFVDAPSGGTLLLTDLHTGPDGVLVSHGLFSVVLGAGTLSPGTEPGLPEVFANHSPVYLEVQVGAETLSPRVRVVSAGFALNASRLGGFAPGFYLDTSSAPQTKAGSLTSSTGLAGNAPGAGDGVAGTSAAGVGVRGTSTGPSGALYGVYGKTSSTDGSGVFGEATATSGSAWGVQGKSASATGLGVLGSNLSASGNTEGVRGQSTSPTGRGVVGGAFATTGDARGVYGESQSSDGTGVYGRATKTTGSTTGVGGDCFSTLGTGVAGVANATSGDAWGVYGATLSSTGYGVVSDGDSGTFGDIYASGTKFFITGHPREPDKAIRYACLEGGEVGVYHRGVAKLVHGEARIALPDHFPMVASGNLTVHLTPQEDCGGLYVPEDALSSEGFTVRESGGGTSDASFSYLVVADRRGFENLSVVTPVTLVQKIFLSPRFTHAEKTALRAALGSLGDSGLSAASRTALFELLDAGDYAGSCRALGGCARGTSPYAAGALDWQGARPAGLPGTDVAETKDAAQAGDALQAGDTATHAGDGAQAGSGAGSRDPGRPAASGAADRTAREGRPREDSGRIEPALVPVDIDVRGLEHQPVAEAVDAGDVLLVDSAAGGSLRRAAAAADRRVVGVAAQAAPAGARVAVVLSGTTLCRVDADYGAIAPGDLLVASPTPGHAMRAADPAAGTVVGKALEALDGGRGVVRVLVMLR